MTNEQKNDLQRNAESILTAARTAHTYAESAIRFAKEALEAAEANHKAVCDLIRGAS